MTKKLLITGFDPFGEDSINPSWEAVQKLPDIVGDFVLCKLQIPTVFDQAANCVLQQANEFGPDVILCVGQAGGRNAVTPERIAVNIRDARIVDNAGNQPQDALIIPDGPAAYFATVPVTSMVDAIQQIQLPADVSNSAGTFVCNDVLYTLLHHYANSDTKVGFIHVPYLPEQGAPSMTLDQIVSALIAAICAC